MQDKHKNIPFVYAENTRCQHNMKTQCLHKNDALLPKLTLDCCVCSPNTVEISVIDHVTEGLIWFAKPILLLHLILFDRLYKITQTGCF
jgi:hypothetical protein